MDASAGLNVPECEGLRSVVLARSLIQFLWMIQCALTIPRSRWFSCTLSLIRGLSNPALR
jgi:hypothetical protein